jgi:hypothetical protein
VSEAAQFITLKGVPGSGEKELPRRLGAVVGHGDLRYYVGNVLHGYSTAKDSIITSHRGVHSLWKAVENGVVSPEACSGCGGDYEDPDWSRWEEEEFEGKEEEAGDEPGSGE